MKVTHCLSILAIAAIVASCTKDGATGPAGATGATGSTGTNGIANIITSTYTVTSSSWTATSAPAYKWSAACVDTNITANNVDIVEVYWSTTLGTGWTPLPDPSVINFGDNMSYRFNDDTIAFTYYTGGGSYTSAPSSYPGYGTIIYVVTIVPPVLQLANPTINWNNAAEVAKLPEMQAALSGIKK